ncbi:MAG: metallophosphoesterase family protein, partial [Candidatus Hermodarchaeota archaeon]
MVKFGIISDTHLSTDDDPGLSKSMMRQLKEIFLDVDEIIHAGDINEPFILDLLTEIAPTHCVKGEADRISGINEF